MSPTSPKSGFLWLDTWAGRSHTPIDVIGQTPTRWRIRARQRTQLAGRGRWLEAGDVAIVPRHVVSFGMPPVNKAIQ